MTVVDCSIVLDGVSFFQNVISSHGSSVSSATFFFAKLASRRKLSTRRLFHCFNFVRRSQGERPIHADTNTQRQREGGSIIYQYKCRAQSIQAVLRLEHIPSAKHIYQQNIWPSSPYALAQLCLSSNASLACHRIRHEV